ncbi:aromatic amino acid transporter AroP [Neobacillus piezotolerans]|uniref:Aromatic amino acid transporter AroP n=1 Tax=Neobacillus piezotolerans TaxID=2259171 RepID=A0A3D8GQI2_9BACI|nr:amino acid permease [Neobacillus piezotolerans]RDU36750.1 aromatic amino acid transporter AroP [Neobacillus piezotolerans]
MEENKLKRGLSNRHIQLIALGGTIGVGLFYGSAATIKLAGPAILLSYLFGGAVIYFIMRALGEMAVANPVSGSFSEYANKYVGPFAGYLTGWTYWFNWIVVGMAEITVVGVYINHWFPEVPQWVSALAALVIMTLINLVNVKAYGEFEFWFALIKVVAIVGMIIAGLGIILFGLGNGGVPVGFGNLWEHGGFAPNGVSGLLLSLVMVMFSFGGIEMIGLTAGEAENPQRTIPSAINNVIWRVLIFYIGALGIIMILYPWDEIGTSGSPFVLIFDKIGMPAAADIINFVVLTAALSAFNSGMYGTGRMLFSLADQGNGGNGPAFFRELSKSGVPVRGVLFSAAILLVAVFLNYIVPEKVFYYITSIATVAAVTSWTVIILTHMKFRESGGSVSGLFPMPFYPYSSYFALAALTAVVVAMAFIEGMAVAFIVAPIWFAVLFTSYKMKESH